MTPIEPVSVAGWATTSSASVEIPVPPGGGGLLHRDDGFASLALEVPYSAMHLVACLHAPAGRVDLDDGFDPLVFGGLIELAPQGLGFGRWAGEQAAGGRRGRDHAGDVLLPEGATHSGRAARRTNEEHDQQRPQREQRQHHYRQAESPE